MPTPITHIGEAAVHLNDRVFIFRPSLANIAQLGTPGEIVETFALVMSQAQDNSHWFEQIGAAMKVLYTCCDEFDRDLESLLGHWVPHPRRYTPGKMQPAVVLAIARQMMRHGVVGEVERQQSSSQGDYKAEFNAVEMAALAQAHLGLSVSEAWAMTMTSLIGTLAAKYPPQKGDGKGPAMTVEQNDAAVSWLEKVNKLRTAANQGSTI